jgi:hypothetical protein
MTLYIWLGLLVCALVVGIAYYAHMRLLDIYRADYTINKDDPRRERMLWLTLMFLCLFVFSWMLWDTTGAFLDEHPELKPDYSPPAETTVDCTPRTAGCNPGLSPHTPYSPSP